MRAVSKIIDIDVTLDALQTVSNNARQKHNTSRSAIRIHELSIDLHKAWQKYKVNHELFVHKELVMFVIKNSSNGLKLNSIIKRTGLPVAKVKDSLTWLEQRVFKINNKYKLKK